MVAGLGMEWAGVGVKAPAARRALQLFSAALGPRAPIVFADGADAIVSNGARHAARGLGGLLRRQKVRAALARAAFELPLNLV